jgi:hypothetical protein
VRSQPRRGQVRVEASLPVPWCGLKVSISNPVIPRRDGIACAHGWGRLDCLGRRRCHRLLRRHDRSIRSSSPKSTGGRRPASGEGPQRCARFRGSRSAVGRCSTSDRPPARTESGQPGFNRARSGHERQAGLLLRNNSEASIFKVEAKPCGDDADLWGWDARGLPEKIGNTLVADSLKPCEATRLGATLNQQKLAIDHICVTFDDASGKSWRRTGNGPPVNK